MSGLPGRPTTLVLIRHAESARNAAKQGSVFYKDDEARKNVAGIPDHKIEITEDGWKQCRATGLYLRKHFEIPDYIYDSGYKRTMQTREGIMEAYSEAEKELIEIRHDFSIRERDAGYAYDMTEGEAKENFPFLADYYAMVGKFMAYPVGGESILKMIERVQFFLNLIIFLKRDDQTVFVVSHGGTIRAFRCILEKWDYDRAQQEMNEPRDNCSIVVYRQGLTSRGRKTLRLDEAHTVPWQAATA